MGFKTVSQAKSGKILKNHQECRLTQHIGFFKYLTTTCGDSPEMFTLDYTDTSAGSPLFSSHLHPLYYYLRLLISS